MRVALSLTIFVFALNAGCAFGTRRVNLTYGERVTTQVAPSGTRGRLVIVQFSDGRPADQRELLGKIRNGYGIPTASVVPQQDPILWVSDGMARAFEARGYRVSRVKLAQEAKGKPVITGVVRKVSSGMYARIQADIAADVDIKLADKRIASAQCSGTATGMATTVSASQYQTLFEQALDSFINDCVPRLVEPLDDALGE